MKHSNVISLLSYDLESQHSISTSSVYQALTRSRVLNKASCILLLWLSLLTLSLTFNGTAFAQEDPPVAPPSAPIYSPPQGVSMDAVWVWQRKEYPYEGAWYINLDTNTTSLGADSEGNAITMEAIGGVTESRVYDGELGWTNPMTEGNLQINTMTKGANRDKVVTKLFTAGASGNILIYETYRNNSTTTSPPKTEGTKTEDKTVIRRDQWSITYLSGGDCPDKQGQENTLTTTKTTEKVNNIDTVTEVTSNVTLAFQGPLAWKQKDDNTTTVIKDDKSSTRNNSNISITRDFDGDGNVTYTYENGKIKEGKLTRLVRPIREYEKEYTLSSPTDPTAGPTRYNCKESETASRQPNPNDPEDLELDHDIYRYFDGELTGTANLDDGASPKNINRSKPFDGFGRTAYFSATRPGEMAFTGTIENKAGLERLTLSTGNGEIAIAQIATSTGTTNYAQPISRNGSATIAALYKRIRDRELELRGIEGDPAALLLYYPLYVKLIEDASI